MIIVFFLMSLIIFSRVLAFEIDATFSAGYESNPALNPNDEESSSLAIYALEMNNIFSLPSSFEADLIFTGLYRDYFECGDTFQGSASLELHRSFFLQRLIPSIIFTSEIYRDKIIKEDEKDAFTVDFGAHYILSPQLIVGFFSAWMWDYYKNDVEASDNTGGNHSKSRARWGPPSSTITGPTSYSPDSDENEYLHTLSFSLNLQPKRFFYFDCIYKNSRLSVGDYISDEFILNPTFITPQDIIFTMTASFIRYRYHSAQESDDLRPEQELYVSMIAEREFGRITPYILISWKEGLISLKEDPSVTEKHYQNKVIECGISILF